MRKFVSGVYQGCGIFLSLTCASFFILFLLKILGFYDKADFFIDKYILSGRKNMDANQLDTFKKLIENDTIISADTIFSQTLEYYDTLITFLVAILGVVGAIAFFYIKGSSEEKAKEYAKKSTSDYFNTVSFDKLVQNKINDTLDSEDSNYRRDSEAFFEKSDKIDQLDKLTKSIDDRLKSIEILNEKIIK